ncbi:MAG: PaaI family thioesterase [Pseudomonadota bacterium]
MSEEKTKIDANIPAGWKRGGATDTFGAVAGPYYWREDGAPGVAFLAEQKHLNLAGMVHGGALLTLADMAIFDGFFKAGEQFYGVTVSLNSEFLAPGRPGDFIIGVGEPVRVGKSLLIGRGMLTAGDRTLLTFSGVLKRLNAPRGGAKETDAPSGSP